MARTLFILYNADGSIMGKLNYGYRKLTSSSKGKDCTPACAACDITHGGLHLDETSEWKKVKREVCGARSGGGDGGIGEVKQLHRDELGGDMKEFIRDGKLQFPMVLASGQEGGPSYDVVMNKEELAAFGGSADRFLEGLQKKGLLSASSAPSL